MLSRMYRSLVVVGFSVVAIFEIPVAQAELKANPNRCLFKKFNIEALGNGFSLPSDNLGTDDGGLTRSVVAYISAAATSKNSNVKAVSAKRMKKLCNDMAALDPTVIAASPDYEVQVNATTSNDPSLSSLYGIQKISAPLAWDTNTGSDSVVVGVIDTGIDLDHPDLVDNLWTNTGEIAGNGIDDDANGYIDDIHGYDFHNNDGNPDDDNGHGSHCAGTIGGRGNNAIGVAGVSWTVKMMALKFLSGSGSGYLSNAIRAINYATANGASFTSNSWGGGGYSQTMFDTIDAARAAGQLFIAAAGNSGLNADQLPMYPAAYDLPNIISVAATDSNDNLAYFSNYGATKVDLAAPGVSIYSTYKNGGYATLSGTSMATPHVSGAAALVLAANPSFTYADLKDALLNNVDYVAGLSGYVATSGRLNVAAALSQDGGGGGGSEEFQFTLENISNSASQAYLYGNQDNILTVSGTDNITIRLKSGNLSCQLYSGSVDSTYSKLLNVKSKYLSSFKRLSFEADNTTSVQTIEAKIFNSKASKANKETKGASKSQKTKKFSKICDSFGGTLE